MAGTDLRWPSTVREADELENPSEDELVGTLIKGILRMYPVPLTNIIDVKTGDIDIMRNYSGWGIKKVRFKTYACPGIDTAVSVKAAGRLVITVTTSDPEGLAAVLRSGAAESREAGE